MKYKNGQMTNSLPKLLIYMPTPGRIGQLTILKFHDIHAPHFLGTDCHFFIDLQSERSRGPITSNIYKINYGSFGASISVRGL